MGGGSMTRQTAALGDPFMPPSTLTPPTSTPTPAPAPTAAAAPTPPAGSARAAQTAAGSPMAARARDAGASATPGDILLDAGTNELEVLVFRLRGQAYGVNVAKVREVIRSPEPTGTPGMHSSVLGMFNCRGKLIPLVDLGRHLGIGDTDPATYPDLRVIIMEFNGLQTGFVVDGVDQIHRVSWQMVREAPDLDALGGAEAAVPVGSCTGVLQLDGRLILMIDFESISDAIVMEKRLHVDRVENPDGVDRARYRVFLAEDSPFMRSLMDRVMRSSGYTRLEVFPNGQEAWLALEAAAAGDAGGPVHAVVSDIEMPLMDGLHLTRRIKEHPVLKDVPVVLFSSLVSADNEKKGRQVGASLQIPKPELPEMVRLIDKAVTGRLEMPEA